MHWIDIALVIASIVFVMLFGLKFAHKQDSTNSYFAAGGSIPAWAIVSGRFSSRRSRISPFFRFRTAMVSALPPIPAARASSAYFFPATWALQLTMLGSSTAFSRPWAT